MAALLRGRQTQFYIDVLYGLAFAVGFGYLLLFGMDARVAAFQGGIVLGYFLRVWENMHIYERILEEEVAPRAREEVEAEVESRVPEQVEEKLEDEVPEQVEAEVESQVPEQIEEGVEAQVPDRVEEEVETQLADEVETKLIDRIGETDEELAERLREHLESGASADDGGAAGTGS
jgi:hypothetical protein